MGMPGASTVRIGISPDSRDDARYDDLAAVWRSRGFEVDTWPPLRRKESSDFEAYRDILIYLANHVPDAVLGAIVADVWNASGPGESARRRTFRSRACGVRGSSRSLVRT